VLDDGLLERGFGMDGRIAHGCNIKKATQ